MNDTSPSHYRPPPGTKGARAFADPNNWIGVSAAAERYKISKSTLYRHLRFGGILPHHSKRRSNPATGRKEIYIFIPALDLIYSDMPGLKNSPNPKQKRQIVREIGYWFFKAGLVGNAAYDLVKEGITWMMTNYGDLITYIVNHETLIRGSLSQHPRLGKLAPKGDSMTREEVIEAVNSYRVRS